MRTWIEPRWFGLLMAVILAVSPGGARAEDRARLGSFVDIKGVTHTPQGDRDVRAVVLFFVVTDCPVANYFTSEINAIVKDHASAKVRFFIVHVDPTLTVEGAGKHAKEYGLTCPVVIDTRHTLVKATGATVTPEAVVLTSDGSIAYRGRIDDRYVELGKRRIAPTRRDVREALAAVLAGRPVKEPRTQAIGCPIPELAPDAKKGK